MGKPVCEEALPHSSEKKKKKRTVINLTEEIKTYLSRALGASARYAPKNGD